MSEKKFVIKPSELNLSGKFERIKSAVMKEWDNIEKVTVTVKKKKSSKSMF